MDYVKILFALVFTVLLVSSAHGCCCCCPCCCRCRHPTSLRLIIHGKHAPGPVPQTPTPTGTAQVARDVTTTVAPRTAPAPTNPPQTTATN